MLIIHHTPHTTHHTLCRRDSLGLSSVSEIIPYDRRTSIGILADEIALKVAEFSKTIYPHSPIIQKFEMILASLILFTATVQ
jgi:hypothetical protein